MCGIICEIRNSGCNSLIDSEVLKRIKNRGPDCFNTAEIDIGQKILYFCGSVLWMQGSSPVNQPLENDRGILLYNGDIFDDTWNNNVNDTELIMDKLSNQSEYSENQIIHQLKLLKGPFSLIYYDKKNDDLYFTRDRIGRSSLLFFVKNNTFIISSVMGRNYDCIEIPAGNILKLELKTLQISLYPWKSTEKERQCVFNDWIDEIKEQQNVPDDNFSFEFDDLNIDLTEKDDVIDVIESASAKEKSCKISLMKNLMQNKVIEQTVHNITNLLEKSIKFRLETQPNKCKNCVHLKEGICTHCTVGILFSGGLDCTILALLADKYVDRDQPIDLINVAFSSSDCYNVPDRITGRQSFDELKNICSSRKWVFKEINVPKNVLEKFQKSTIADLVFPRNTILDESLGSVLWFAANSQGCDSSTCRVVLLGSGADELFGGYLRHRKAYQRHGWLGLARELQLDWNRISFRNLSRDNRVICDHGRQPRMPYLDENFVDYVLSLKPWLRCFPSVSLDCGIGDKLMLRLVALNLGLTNVVTYPKRAMQFGSRIANKKQKASDLSKNFLYS